MEDNNITLRVIIDRQINPHSDSWAGFKSSSLTDKKFSFFTSSGPHFIGGASFLKIQVSCGAFQHVNLYLGDENLFSTK